MHPLRVESVAWISERKDVLSTLFLLLTLLAYRRWVERKSSSRFALVLVLYVLGLLAKPMLVTLPLLLILLDVWPLRRVDTNFDLRELVGLAREKLPLIVIAVAVSIVTFFVQHAAGAVMTVDKLPLSDRIPNAISAYGRYLGATFWPSGLAVYYPNAGTVAPAVLVASACALAVVSAWAWRSRARAPWFLVGWAWFVISLVPVIGLVQVGNQSHADRYTYIPSIGLLVAIVWACALAAERARWLRVIASIAGALVIATLGVATASQVALWKDTKTLFAHALDVTKDNALAHQVYGNALLQAEDLDAGMTHLEEALRLSPDFPDAHNNLGSALGAKGRLPEAIEHFRHALRTQETAQSHSNLGWALMQMGRGDEALPELQRAVEMDPDLPLVDARLGALFTARRRFADAYVHLKRALELAPADLEAHRTLAIAFTLDGRVEEGIAEYHALLKLAPKDLDALNNIAWIRATHGDAAHRNAAEAVRLAEEARAAASQENHVLFSTLAAAYAESGRFEDAVRAGERAVELARQAQDVAAVTRFTQQLELYRAGKAFHQ